LSIEAIKFIHANTDLEGQSINDDMLTAE